MGTKAFRNFLLICNPFALFLPQRSLRKGFDLAFYKKAIRDSRAFLFDFRLFIYDVLADSGIVFLHLHLFRVKAPVFGSGVVMSGTSR